MIRNRLHGVTITGGPPAWAVIQRDKRGTADIPLEGVWKDVNPDRNRTGRVEIRLADPKTNAAISSALNWRSTETSPDGTWRGVLKNVPAGGPYTIETRLETDSEEWRHTGDRIKHVCVGDIWVIAGQSNAVGYGHGPVDDPPCDGVRLFRANEQWDLAVHPLHDPTGSRHPLNFDNGWNDHSPWLSFARRVYRATGVPIGLVPTALGGSPLSRWNPDETGDLYRNMLDFIRAATGRRDYSKFDETDGGPVYLPTDGDSLPRIAGILWYQGCSDTNDENAKSYPDRFMRFVCALREKTGTGDLPFITVQLNRVNASPNGDGWSLIREQQRRIALNDPRIAVVPSLDAGRSDDIHTDPAGNLLIGRRAADAALGMVYGKDVFWRAPDIVSATIEDDQRTRVRMTFDHVVVQLWRCAPEIVQFSASDSEGAVDVSDAQIVGADTIRLSLARPLKNRPVVHNCAGHNPVVCVADKENRPILAFYGVPVR